MKPERVNAELAELAGRGCSRRPLCALRWILVGAWCVAAVQPCFATIVVPMDLTELSRDARAIARGRVVALDPRWTDDRRSVETIVTLEVEAYLKGAFGQTVQFRVSGGTLGRFRSITVGAPEFSIDERIVVFLGAAGPSIPHVLGLNQGVFRVAHAPDGWTVSPPATLSSVSGSARVVRGDLSRRPMALAEFEQRVRALAAGPR
jgi:hypothetical protein